MIAICVVMVMRFVLDIDSMAITPVIVGQIILYFTLITLTLIKNAQNDRTQQTTNQNILLYVAGIIIVIGATGSRKTNAASQ